MPKTNVIPLRVLERGGSLIIQGVLNVMVPRFVKVNADTKATCLLCLLVLWTTETPVREE